MNHRVVVKSAITLAGAVALVQLLPQQHNWPAACAWMTLCIGAWPWMWTGPKWMKFLRETRGEGLLIIAPFWIVFTFAGVAHAWAMAAEWMGASELAPYYKERCGNLSRFLSMCFMPGEFLFPVGPVMTFFVGAWSWMNCIMFRPARPKQ